MGVAVINPANIIEGWSKRLGLKEITPDEHRMAEERLKICLQCPMAKESKMLILLNGTANREKILKCSGCGCPLYEKVIVPEEKCPLGKWKKEADY